MANVKLKRSVLHCQIAISASQISKGLSPMNASSDERDTKAILNIHTGNTGNMPRYDIYAGSAGHAPVHIRRRAVSDRSHENHHIPTMT